MTPACAWCTGSHWLSDAEVLGPCICCTPAALTSAENDVGALQDQISRVQEELAEATERADKLAVEVRLWEEGTDDTQTLADAWSTLQSYLVSIGLAASPITVSNPHLAELVGLLEP